MPKPKSPKPKVMTGDLVLITTVNENGGLPFEGVVASDPYLDGFGRWNVVVERPTERHPDRKLIYMADMVKPLAQRKSQRSRH